MAVFHYVHLRAFIHETEDPAKVLAALHNVVQDDRAQMQETHAQGGHGNKIIILEGEVKAAPGIKRMFAALQRDDPEGFDHVARTMRERVDEELNLHFRLDKQEAAQGKVLLAKDDDAITVRGKLRSFGPDRTGTGLESSLQQLEALFLGLRQSGSSAGQ